MQITSLQKEGGRGRRREKVREESKRRRKERGRDNEGRRRSDKEGRRKREGERIIQKSHETRCLVLFTFYLI